MYITKADKLSLSFQKTRCTQQQVPRSDRRSFSSVPMRTDLFNVMWSSLSLGYSRKAEDAYPTSAHGPWSQFLVKPKVAYLLLLLLFWLFYIHLVCVCFSSLVFVPRVNIFFWFPLESWFPLLLSPIYQLLQTSCPKGLTIFKSNIAWIADQHSFQISWIFRGDVCNIWIELRMSNTIRKFTKQHYQIDQKNICPENRTFWLKNETTWLTDS